MANKALEEQLLGLLANREPDQGTPAPSYADGGSVDDWQDYTPGKPDEEPEDQPQLPAKAQPVAYQAPAKAAAPADDWQDYTPAKQQAQPQAQPTDDWVDHTPGQQPQKPQAEGLIASTGRQLANEAVPLAGSLPMIGAGAALGSFLMPGLGTFAGMEIGGLLGGAVAGGGASFVLGKVQDIVKKALGMDDSEQLAVNAEAHPVASAITDVASAGMAFKPGQLAGSLGSRLANALAMGGVSAGTQLATEGEVDPMSVLESAAGGAIFNEAYAGTHKLMQGGEAAARALTRPSQPAGQPGVASTPSPPSSDVSLTGDPHGVQPGDRMKGGDTRWFKPTRESANGGNPALEQVMDNLPSDFKAALKVSTAEAATPELETKQRPQPAQAGPQNPEPTGLAEQAHPTTPADAQQAQASAQEPVPAPAPEPVNTPGPADEAMGTAAPEAALAPQGGLSKAQIEDLRAIGYSNDHIKGMNPAVAKKILDSDWAKGELKKIDTATPDEEAPKAAPKAAEPEPEIQGERDFAAEAPVPAEDEAAIPEHAKPTAFGPDSPDVAEHPEIPGLIIDRSKTVPEGAKVEGDKVLVDKSVPREVDVKSNTGKGTVKIDPAEALVMREAAKAQVESAVKKSGKDLTNEVRQYLQEKTIPETDRAFAQRRSIDPKSLTETLDGFAKPVAVTEPVTKPGLLEKAKEFMGNTSSKPVVRGLKGAIERVQKHPDLTPEAKAKIIDGLKTAPADIVKKVYDQLRNPENRAVTEAGVQAQTKGKAAAKDAVANALKKAYDAAAPKELNRMPTTRAEQQALLDRVRKAVDAAGDKIDNYGTRVKDAPYQWMQKARALLDGEITTAKIHRFAQDEMELRAGGAKDVQDTARINADIERNQRPSSEFAMELGHGSTDITGRPFDPNNQHGFEAAPAEEQQQPRSRLIKAEDLKKLKPDQTIDLTDIRKTDVGKAFMDDMEKLANNLAAEKDTITPRIEAGRRAEMERVAERNERLAEQTQGQLGNRAQEAADSQRDIPRTPNTPAVEPTSQRKTVKLKSGEKAQMEVAKAADKGRSIPVTDELKAKYGIRPDAEKLAAQREEELSTAERDMLDVLGKKAGKPPEEYVPPEEGEEDNSSFMPKISQLAEEFLNKTDGSLNIHRIDSAWKTKLMPRIKLFTDMIGHFQTEPEIKSAAVLRTGEANLTRRINVLAKEIDARWYRFLDGVTKENQIKYQMALEDSEAWDKTGKYDRQRFLDELTTSLDPKTQKLKWGLPKDQAEIMADEAPFHRVVMDGVWEAENRLGSKADYVQNYISHLFKNEEGAQDYILSKIDKEGEDWFTKSRSIDRIMDAVQNGKFELKYPNPIDVLGARVRASLKYQQLEHTMAALQKIGSTVPTKDAEGAQKLWKYQVLINGRQWRVNPNVEALVKNAVTSVGLRDRNNTVGSLYRAWMDVKNTFIPIKLGISAFHWVHVVLNVNLAANIAREITNASALTKEGTSLAKQLALKNMDAKAGSASLGQKVSYLGRSIPGALKLSMQDALYSLPIDRFGHLGKDVRTYFDTPDDKLNADGKFSNNLLAEGGGVPHRNEQDIIRDRHKFDELMKDNKYLQALPYGAQQGVKMGTAFMFEHQIPNLKAAAFMRDAQALFERRPDLIANKVQRQIALQGIMQSVDNRFGEMFYNGVFMNKILKDTAIGSTLSLGWNLGQLREFGGALSNAVTGKGRLNDVIKSLEAKNNLTASEEQTLAQARKGVGPSQQTLYEATNKGAYTAAYTATSMASAGLLTAALTGTVPNSWKDYFFPRVGGIDQEGQPRRLTTPFNTREPFMLQAHMQQEGPIGGIAAFLYNKMVLSPLVDAVKNRDYFGNELFDSNAPWYKKALQLVDSELGENLNPITMSSYQRGIEQGGSGVKSGALAFSGFGPAPAYVNRSPLQRRLTEMYNEHAKPESRPYQDRGPLHAAYNYVTGAEPSPQDKLRTARAAYNKAVNDGDSEGMHQAQVAMAKSGDMSKTTAKNQQPGDADRRMFARIPLQDQLALAKDMSPEEYDKLVQKNHLVHASNRLAIRRLRESNQ